MRGAKLRDRRPRSTRAERSNRAEHEKRPTNEAHVRASITSRAALEAITIRRYGSDMRSRFIAPLLFACVALLGGCGDKSAVALSVNITDANVSAQTSAFGATLGGGFTLEFALGPEASGSTTVTLGSFALQSASGTAILDPLPVDAVGATFPLTVDKGGSQNVTFTIASKASLTQDEQTAICAGQVVIVGAVMDSLSGGTDSLKSVALTPTCS